MHRSVGGGRADDLLRALQEGPSAPSQAEVLGDQNDVVPPSDIFVVGFNRLPSPNGPRKIVWAGRVSRVMTFAQAHALLSGPRYAKMLASKQSPMNVEPIPAPNGGPLLGYRRRPNGIHPKSWPLDLVTTMRRAERHGDELLPKGASPTRAFQRDACFTAENIFFANGAGLAINEAFVRILTDAQPWARDIDAVAVFGRVHGTAEGLRGRYLTLSGGAAERVVEWLRRHSPRAGHEDPARSSAPSARRSPRACR